MWRHVYYTVQPRPIPQERNRLREVLAEKFKALNRARGHQPASTAEYVVGHPIYAFYRHLWREDRVLFAKVASVAFIHGLDLLYSVPYLQWLAPIYVGQQVQEYNTDFYALIEKAAEFDTHLASQYGGSVIWMTLLRSCRHFWQKRVNKECQRACERIILERLLFSEADYDVRGFAEAGLAELLAKNVHHTVSIINSLPALFVAITVVAINFRRQARERSGALWDLSLLLVHPVLAWGVSYLWNRLAYKPLVNAMKPVDAVLKKRRWTTNTLRGLLDIQLNNLQFNELHRFDLLDTLELNQRFSSKSFFARTALSITDTQLAYQITDVYARLKIMKMRGWTYKEYARQENQLYALRSALWTMKNLLIYLRSSYQVQRDLYDLYQIPNYAHEHIELSSPVPSLEVLEITDLEFTYPNAAAPAISFEATSLKMKCGQTYALIGANGSGKSTLATLICRLFTPSKGAILWNGVPTNSYARLRLRNHIAFVPQVPYLFAGSIEENIRIGNPDASDAQVVTAAVAAGLVGAATPPEMIKELLAQRVEEDGKNLSGGIGKAIAFARIFVKPTADLVILDETTAHVDNNKQHHILLPQLMSFVKHNKQTLIFITHELQLLKYFENVIYLESGKVGLQGTYLEVMADEKLKALLTLATVVPQASELV